MIKAAFIVLLLLISIHFASSRSFRNESNLVANGMDQKRQSRILQLGLRATSVTCEPIYSFLPCTTEVWGQLFLMVVYEYLLSLSEKYISNGSDLFFKMFGTGIFGASVFQILGMFPQVLLVLVNGFSGSEATIESVAAIGMGMVAGSVIMNLTIIWGSVIAFGSYNYSRTSNPGTKRRFSFTGYGVTTDAETKYTSGIMLLSMIPFLLLQLAKFLSTSSAKRLVVLVSLIITLIFLITYCTYQVFQPWIQDRRLEYLMRKYVRNNLLQILTSPDGKPSESKIRDLFRKIDRNDNTQISAAELRALILGIQIKEVGLNKDDFVSKVMEEFDISGDSNINEAEFIQGLSKWLTEANPSAKGHDGNQKKLSTKNPKGTTEEQQSLVVKSLKSKDPGKPVWWNYLKASFLILLGTAMTILLAKPLIETVQDFSTAINIPSFLVSYFVIPLALRFRQAYRAITSAREKTEKAISLTLSEIYGGVFMNNIIGLVTFLALVYIRDLTWDVSAEILVVLIICSAMGLSASFSSKFPFWTSIAAFALYPISLAFLYVLTTVLGWD